MTEDRGQKTEDKGGKPAHRRPSSVVRRLFKWTFLSLAGFMMLLLLLWAGLQTPWAKKELARIISDITEKTGDYRVAIEGLGGLLPFSITLEGATISDAKGPWLEMEKFDFAMDPIDLISGLINVKWLRMAHVDLSRLPESREASSKPEKAPTEKTPFALPNILVQEIRLQRIDLGESLAGKPMSFSLNSRLKTAVGHIHAEASLKDLNRDDDAFQLKAAYDLKTEHLAADVDYHESPGGLVAGLLGLKELDGIQLEANAKGPVSHMKGSLNLKMGGYGSAVLSYDVRQEKGVALQLSGQIRAESAIVPPPLARLMESETVDLTLNASLSPEKAVHLKGLRIQNGKTVVGLEGAADLEKETMDIRARIEGVDPTPFLEGTGITLADPAPVLISAAGPFTAPEITLSTALAEFRDQTAALSETTLNLHALFEKGFTGLKNATVTLDAQKLRVQQAPNLKGPLKVTIFAQSPDFSTWQVSTLNMTVPGVDVSVKEALVDLTDVSFSGTLAIQADRISPFLPPETPALDGRLSISAQVKGAGSDNLTAQMNLMVSQLRGLPPEASAIAGSKVTLDAKAEMKGGRLILQSVDLKGSQTRLTADGWMNLKENLFDVNYRITLDNSGSSIPEKLPRGDVASNGNISGKFDDFAARVALSSRNLQLNDLEMKNLNAELKAAGLPGKPSGNIRLKAWTMEQPLQFKSDFVWTGKALTLKETAVQAPGIDLAAALELSPETEDFTGKIEGRITSLEMIEAIAGVAAQGTGTFQIEAGKPDTAKGGSSVTLRADFKGLKYQDYGASTVNIRARVDDIKEMRGQASLKATDMPIGSSTIETLNLAAKGALSGAEITLETKGVTRTVNQAGTGSESPLFLNTKIGVKRTDLWQLRLDSLKAGYEGVTVTLQKPANLSYGDDGRILLDDLQLKTDKGLLQANARLEKDSVEARLRITDLPLSLLEPFVGQDLDGKAELALDLSGPLADPGISTAIHIKEYKIMGRDGSKPILLNVKVNTRRNGERLLADLELSGLGKTPFKADGSIPAHISLKPFVFDLDKSGKLEGKLEGAFNLAILQTLPAMNAMSLQGKVDVAMGIGGSIEKWALNGGVTITGGRFENVAQGVLLDRIEGRLDAEGRILKLTRLAATDGGTGSISLNGQTDVDPPFQTEIALTMKQATLLRKEMLTVTAGGNLNVKGNKDRMDLTGEVNLDRTEIEIPKSFPPDVAVIPVTTINDPSAAASEKSAPPKGDMLLRLNIGVNIPDKFFVRGRGLDVEFKGRLAVKGPADNPVITGTLNVVRGTFLCLSRTFKVTSGQIAFDGTTPPVPYLNINTQVNAGDITAQVDVTGPADAFKLKLSSQPSLPQDEIMAQILFGQSVAKLNTFQALQLAYSVNQLAGGYGPDLMGKTRSFLGLDRLDFSGGDQSGTNNNGSTNDSTGPSVTLGKYVSDRVYVGVEQDLTDSKQDVIVEVNITPNFSVESKAGSRSGAGLGFNWNYDY